GVRCPKEGQRHIAGGWDTYLTQGVLAGCGSVVVGGGGIPPTPFRKGARMGVVLDVGAGLRRRLGGR
ncbi:MAG: hypothetical protein VX638_12950, partial [Chloroflexota bacterium]|nr:hypothetical protein [Chloroflexota bacterium]